MATVLKTVNPARGSRVRIPPSPPFDSRSDGRSLLFHMMSSATKAAILESLGSSEGGLTDVEIADKRKQHGWNEVAARAEPLWKLLVSQFNDVKVYILLAAVAVSVVVPLVYSGEVHQQEFMNAAVILAIVILNGLLGFAQEWRAENAIAMLQKLSAPHVRVRRNGHVMQIPSRELLPGDVMLVEAGDKISADGHLFLTASMEVDESSLTGESVPVSKRPSLNSEEQCKVFAGTIVTRGSGEAVVTGTGLQTEIGKITSMVMTLKPPPTPLQLQLKRLGGRIGIMVLALCVLIFLLGLVKGMPAIDIFFTAVSLAVAAVPEGLPAIVTICLAIGVRRMIGKNALIRRLDAIETLGNINVICADKTGTMTQNRMEVVEYWVPDGHSVQELAHVGASCSKASLPDIGDPTEIALLHFAQKHDTEPLVIDEEEVPFTSEEKYMVTRHVSPEGTVRYAKGAIEVMLGMMHSTQTQAATQKNIEFAEQGLRVLAMAKDSGNGWELVGLTAMLDPPRPEVQEAIAIAQRAGIRTIMITGDNPVTALHIARKVGIVTSGVVDGKALEGMNTEELQLRLKSISVFARVQPAHKVKILEALQQQGNVVAMSGDGVNDAPALKRAHVGIAMGQKGTDVSRESAAMVLTDDNYATIVAAIAEGRRIYDNIRKFIVFLLRSNLGEVLIIASAMLLNMPLPLLPLHILWVNLVTDSLPALALAAEKGEKDIMLRQPRDRSMGILTGEMTMLFVAGILNAILALSLFALSLRWYPDDLSRARTVALTTTIVFQMLLSYSTRVRGIAFFESPFGNPWLIGAIGCSLLLHLLLLTTPLGILFSVSSLPLTLWGIILFLCLVLFFIFEAVKWLVNRSTHRSGKK